MLQRGFSATSVDAVLARASVAKGGFFHHFASKNALGLALVERYAEMDERLLDELIADAEAASEDPAERVLTFLRAFELGAAELAREQPGCLFAAFVHERELGVPGVDEVIAKSMLHWRARLLAMLEAAGAAHPPSVDADLPSLADQALALFEGGFILARALDDRDVMRRQLAHLRHYVALLFGVPAEVPPRDEPAALPA